MRAFKTLSISERELLLSDGWELSRWLENIDGSDVRQLRPMILYLLFPDDFERIFGGGDRRTIVSIFDDIELKNVKKLTPYELDKRLSSIRKREQAKFPEKVLDFYTSPLKELWKTLAGPEGIKTIKKEHVLMALEQIDTDGLPPDAQSTFYDLIYDTRRYPPKYVLSLAGEHANGTKIDRGLFAGGEQSTAFRHLRKLDFQIEAKNTLVKLVQDFLEQADEGSNLGTSGYPRKYGDIDVSVSFGKGNLARVPWIAFTGYGQKVQDGIYPVLLYFKSDGLLILSYGKSETIPPEIDWINLDKTRNISSVLNSKYGITPARYGSSYVGTIYELKSGFDCNKVAADIDSMIAEYRAMMDEAGATVQDNDEAEAYLPEDALEELFIVPEKFDAIISLLKRKKNIILQGPPGVGKTFVCKRLAYSFMGEKAADRLCMVQFHQTYSYEDFIQGYRPSGTGFTLKDGVFFSIL